MKIELKKTDDNHLAGWDIIAESIKEKRILGSIRNALFFGIDSTEPEYDGCEDEIAEDENGKEHRYITKIKYVIPKYKKK